MSDFTIRITERRQPNGQSVRLRVNQFQEEVTSSCYHHTAHEVMFVTERFYTFFEVGLPYNRMLVLRSKLIAQLKTEPHHH